MWLLNFLSSEKIPIRKISGFQILIFSSTLMLIVILAVILDVAILWHVPLADFRGVVMTAFGIFLIYVLAIASYRLMLWQFPLLPGEFPIGSRQEFVYHVYIIFFLLLFYTVMRSGIVPVPIMRLFYQALGAKMGENSYSSGIMFDPSFVRMGKNCIIGQSAQIIPHVIEGGRLAMYPILLEDNVTVGANAIVFADVVIGNNAIIAAGAVISKGTRILDGEVWGGVPAKRLKQPVCSYRNGQDAAALAVDETLRAPGIPTITAKSEKARSRTDQNEQGFSSGIAHALLAGAAPMKRWYFETYQGDMKIKEAQPYLDEFVFRFF